MSTTPTNQELMQQLIAAQETIMHLQHDLHEMHEVVLALQEEIQTLTRRQNNLERRMEVGNGEALPPVLDERPPHY
jgi:SlyX protein